MTKKYHDIINLPRHISRTRPPMPIRDRAAQFSPFAALTGHEAAIRETGRITEKRMELDPYMKDVLNRKLQILKDRLKEGPEIQITYFQEDRKKEGGSYITVRDVVKKIDPYEQIIFMGQGREIPMDEIISIEGQIFP